jgi:hypothetical protein
MHSQVLVCSMLPRSGATLADHPREPSVNDACPLCGGPNDCRMTSPEPGSRADDAARAAGECWCRNVEVPAGLIERVPEDLRNRRCICPACVKAYASERGTE